MSDRLHRGAVAVWTAMAAAAPLHAQSVADLRERVQRIERAYEAAVAVARDADSARRALFTVPPESATVGALHVFATPASIPPCATGWAARSCRARNPRACWRPRTSSC